MAFFRDGKPGVGVGSIDPAASTPILLSTWTFGCHAFRHLVGGKRRLLLVRLREPRQGLRRLQAWSLVTWLNERHMLFAWV